VPTSSKNLKGIKTWPGLARALTILLVKDPLCFTTMQVCGELSRRRRLRKKMRAERLRRL